MWAGGSASVGLDLACKSDIRFGSRLCKNADVEVCRHDRVLRSRSYALIASMRPPTPRMLITLFMLYARTCSAISVPTCLSVFIWKCVDPIHDFIVPNGCSTVWRRRRIFTGFRSSLAWTASRTASCSQREIRRSLPVVHWPPARSLGTRWFNSAAVSGHPLRWCSARLAARRRGKDKRRPPRHRRSPACRSGLSREGLKSSASADKP